MSEHKVIIHRGVAGLLSKHFGEAVVGRKATEGDGGCGCSVCIKANAAEQQVLKVMGPCYVAVLVGYEVLSASPANPKQQQSGSGSCSRVVACFKLRRLCSHIATAHTKDALSLDLVLQAMMERDDDVVRDLRSVRAALPLGVKIVGLAVAADASECQRVSKDKSRAEEDKQLQFKQINKIARELNALITRGDQIDEDGGVRLSSIFESEEAGKARFILLPSFESPQGSIDEQDATKHFSAFEINPYTTGTSSDKGAPTGLCTKLSNLSDASKGKTEETYFLNKLSVAVEDLRECWHLEPTHVLLRSRLPINLRLSSSAYAAVLEQEGLSACCCPKGLLCPSLPPEAAEEIVQQLQQQDALLQGEDALFFQMPDGSWVAPTREAGATYLNHQPVLARDEPSVGAALAAAKKVSRSNCTKDKRTYTPTNHNSDDGGECLDYQAVKYWGMLENKWADCSWAMESLRRDSSIWIPVSRRSSNQVAGSVVAEVICRGNSDEEGSALWSPGTSVLLPEGVVKAVESAAAETTSPNSCGDDLRMALEAHRFAAKANSAPSLSLVVLEAMVLVKTSVSQTYAAGRLLHAMLNQLRYIGACISYMALQPERADVRGGLAPVPRSSCTSLATQTTAVHLSLLSDGLSPRLSLCFHSFLPQAFAVPISAYAVQTPQLRVSWMDLCAMRSIAPSFVSQRVLRPLGPEVSRLISVCSAQMMRVQYASNNALSKDQNERVTAQSHASAHGFEFACDFVSSQPHRAIAAGPKWMRSCRQACVIGDFEYFHYLQDGVKDEGWGCCYRALQTICSWYRLQGYTTQPILSITEIQRLLKKNDPAFSDLAIGSGQWIGTLECLSIVGWYLGFGCRVLHLQSVRDISSYTDVLFAHFESGRAPAIMGIGQYAYTMVGIATNAEGETAYLIVDPHYTGDDDIKTILEKGWVSWKKFEFLEKTANSTFVNVLLPHTTTEEGSIVF